jgi:hypothetical protein
LLIDEGYYVEVVVRSRLQVKGGSTWPLAALEYDDGHLVLAQVDFDGRNHIYLDKRRFWLVEPESLNQALAFLDEKVSPRVAREDTPPESIWRSVELVMHAVYETLLELG